MDLRQRNKDCTAKIGNKCIFPCQPATTDIPEQLHHVLAFPLAFFDALLAIHLNVVHILLIYSAHHDVCSELPRCL